MAIHDLVGRGIDAARRHGHEVDWQEKMDKFPKPLIAAVVVTLVGYMLMHLYISYVYGIMVPVMVITEAPQKTTVIRTTEYRDEADNDENNPDAPLLTKEEKEQYVRPRDEEVLVIKHRPITAKLCTALKHVRERTGTRFHGAGAYFIYTGIAGIVGSVARMAIPPHLSLLRIPVNASVCLFAAAWIQSMLAMPATSNYFRLVSDLRRNGHFKQLFLSTMAVEFAEQVVVRLPRSTMIVAHDINRLTDGRHKAAITVVGTAFMVFLTLFMVTAVVIPLNVGLIRLQAALLPEKVETVIPIDRSLGAAARRNVKTAWWSFSRDGLRRLVKTFVKVAIMQIALGLFTVIVIGFEMRIGAPEHFDRAVNSTMEAYRG